MRRLLIGRGTDELSQRVTLTLVNRGTISPSCYPAEISHLSAALIKCELLDSETTSVEQKRAFVVRISPATAYQVKHLLMWQEVGTFGSRGPDSTRHGKAYALIVLCKYS